MDQLPPNGHVSPVTCAQLAVQLGRNPVSIFRAIKRLGIEPHLITAGGFKFYDPAVATAIDAGMRRPNKAVAP